MERVTQRGISRRLVLMGGLTGALSSCGNMRFPIAPDKQAALAEQDINVIRVTSDTIGQYRTPAHMASATAGRNPPPSLGRYIYRVGQGDQLQITFYADPSGVVFTDEGTPQALAVIDESGRFFYPFVGAISAQGRTVSQIRADLTTRLEQFFATPQVEVAVTQFNARRVTITGAVTTPGRKTLTNVPETLLDFVNEAGAEDGADLSRIVLRRHGKQYLVNLQRFLRTGDRAHNPTLHADDLIQVPQLDDNKVFTFGEINVGEITLDADTRKTLIEVLAEAGGIDRVRADARGIFVFRRDSPARAGFDVYQFDLSNAAALVLAADFGMAPLDIVFVTNDPATRWSDTIGTVIKPFDSLLQARRTGRSLAGENDI